MMKKKWWIPILVILLFSVESNVLNFLPDHFFSFNIKIIPYFLVLLFIFLAVYYDRNMALIYALALGLVMDLAFTEILGIYLFWYPVTVYFVSKLMKILHPHLIIMAFVYLLSISFLEFGLYGIYYIIKITNLPLESFVEFRLVPTLIGNIIFYVIVSYPLKKYFTTLKKIKEQEQGMFQS